MAQYSLRRFHSHSTHCGAFLNLNTIESIASIHHYECCRWHKEPAFGETAQRQGGERSSGQGFEMSSRLRPKQNFPPRNNFSPLCLLSLLRYVREKLRSHNKIPGISLIGICVITSLPSPQTRIAWVTMIHMENIRVFMYDVMFFLIWERLQHFLLAQLDGIQKYIHVVLFFPFCIVTFLFRKSWSRILRILFFSIIVDFFCLEELAPLYSSFIAVPWGSIVPLLLVLVNSFFENNFVFVRTWL